WAADQWPTEPLPATPPRGVLPREMMKHSIHMLGENIKPAGSTRRKIGIRTNDPRNIISMPAVVEPPVGDRPGGSAHSAIDSPRSPRSRSRSASDIITKLFPWKPSRCRPSTMPERVIDTAAEHVEAI